MQQIAPLVVPLPLKIQMNKPAFLPLWLLTLLFVAGCASNSPMSRIDQNRAQFESWPLDVQDAILSGEARKGMTPEQVEMALGRPTQIVSRGSDEVWVYRKSTPGAGLLDGISIGGGTGGIGVGGSVGTGARRQTPEEQEVVFGKGVVVRSDAKR
jgi:hypothetical protein